MASGLALGAYFFALGILALGPSLGVPLGLAINSSTFLHFFHGDQLISLDHNFRALIKSEEFLTFFKSENVNFMKAIDDIIEEKSSSNSYLQLMLNDSAVDNITEEKSSSGRSLSLMLNDKFEKEFKSSEIEISDVVDLKINSPINQSQTAIDINEFKKILDRYNPSTHSYKLFSRVPAIFPKLNQLYNNSVQENIDSINVEDILACYDNEKLQFNPPLRRDHLSHYQKLACELDNATYGELTTEPERRISNKR